VNSDGFDLTKFRLDQAVFSTTPVPTKIRKRREQFVQMPMWWAEALAMEPIATGSTFYLAIHLWHLDWKNHGKPFTLANGMLEYDGISRQTKWRALRDLERRGLIRVECRDRKSPIIHMVRRPATFQS
jgi:hypothetical protein